MQRYRAWRIENCEKVKMIEFEVKSLRAAKIRATQDLIVEYGVWTQGTVFLPNRERVTGWSKAPQGRDGALGLSPKIDLIEIQENTPDV